MLGKIWSNIAATTTTAGVCSSGGIAIGGGEARGLMCARWVRYMSKKRAENLKKINPRVPHSQAFSIAQHLFNLFHKTGPITLGTAWTSAQEAGVNGLSSKTHMKLILKWMRGKNMITQICQQTGSNKKFLLCTPDAAKIELATKATAVKAPPKAKNAAQKRKEHIKMSKSRVPRRN